MVRLMQTVHQSCTNTNTVSKWTETRFDMTHVTRGSFGCVQNDFWAYGTISATMHLSCIKIRTISKRTETSFLLSLVTLEYHRVCLKWLLCQSYVWRKLFTYLELTLTPYPNEPKRDLTRPTSPRGSIGCVENDLQAYGTFNTHHAPIFRQD
jgi:hypothetical protein